MKDLVDRSLVKGIIQLMYDGCSGDAMDYRDLMYLRVNELPNEHVQGEWLPARDDTVYCSRCGYVKHAHEEFWFCPKCGADME